MFKTIVMAVVIAASFIIPVNASAAGPDPGSVQETAQFVKPDEPPLQPTDNKPITYTVGQYMTQQLYTLADGLSKLRIVSVAEDANLIASKFGLTVDDIKYSNPGKDVTQLQEGDKLTLPPVPGIVYTILKGDTLSWIAYEYQVDTNSLAKFNGLANPDQISPDQVIIIPGAKLPPLQLPAPVYSPVSSSGSYAGVPSVSGNHFAFGYCTWYVANRRPIPWFGNAVEWGPAAAAMGFAEGRIPRVGAIMVTYESYLGHVAYVESVNTDGSFVVSEMNWRAWDVIDTRTLTVSQVPLEVFIY